jgi:AcrR family transcriptional regulator
MRKNADKLQVKTVSLYYHVKDKDQLMQLLSEEISGEMAWPDPALPWREQMTQYGEQFRRILHSHRDAVELFLHSFAIGYRRLAQVEKLFSLYVEAGFPDPHIPWMSAMVKNYVLGFVAEEYQLKAIAARQGSASVEALGDQVNELYRQLPQEKFPNVIRLAPYTTPH